MSFFHDAVRPGTSTFHKDRSDEIARLKQHQLRKSKSHADFLTPLASLIRDPAGSIWEILGNLVRGDSPAATTENDGTENRRLVLQVRMKEAETYEDWRAAASELDTLEGNDKWKQQRESPEYDVRLIESHIKQLEEARISYDLRRILFLVRTSLTRSLGGMGDLRLYKHSHIGTKALIERYIESAKETLMTLVDLCDKHSDGAERKHVLDEVLLARQSFGRSALLLSGGGTFGMSHIGVVKTLWEQSLLPRIVSGSSAGSIVCSVLATRTDAQLADVMDEFCYGELDVFEKEGEEETIMRKAARFLKYGSIFDIQHLVRVMRNLLGDLTFQEAYNRTRRILNISVSSAGIHELPRLLNYITAPNVIIWSAVAASCSVPLVFSPASLLAKDPKTGYEAPWNPSPQRWIDGSVDSDLPMTRLAEMFNVNHFIVSQVNPHVIPFLFKEEDRVSCEAEQSASTDAPGSSWVRTAASLAKGEALHRMHMLAELGILPTYFTKLRSILSQRYSGDITILPTISYAHFPRVLKNPTTDFMLESMLSGERATWPKLSRIQNHCAIELALDDAVQKLRAHIVFSPSQIDLRLDTLNTNVGLRSNHERRGRTERAYIESWPSHNYDLEVDSSYSPPQRPRSYFEVRPKQRTPQPLHLQHPLHRRHPSSPALRVAAGDLLSSSADDDHADVNPFTDDTDESIESYSSDSAPPSPLPELWPSTRQLFPSTSQPVTPFFASRLTQAQGSARVHSPHPSVLGHGHSASTVSLMMTPTAPKPSGAEPSSPEVRYKQLFHPNGTVGMAVKETSTSAGAENPHFPSSTEKQRQNSSTTHHARRASGQMSLGGDMMEIDGEDAVIAGSKKKPRSRRGSNVPLVLDISGTRGMMLRRKRSLSSGSGIRGLAAMGTSPTTSKNPFAP